MQVSVATIVISCVSAFALVLMVLQQYSVHYTEGYISDHWKACDEKRTDILTPAIR